MDKFDILDSKKDKDDPEYLREFALVKFKNIAQYFEDESLTEKYGKKAGKVNLVKLRNIVCKLVYDDLVEDWNHMWETENLTEKITKVRQLTKESDPSKIAWRPTTGDISYQVTCLEKRMKADHKEAFDKLIKEKEKNIEKLKEKLSSHWTYCKEMENRIKKYREDNSLILSKIQDKLHSSQSMPSFKKRKLDDTLT